MITNKFDKSKALEVLLYVTSKVEDMYHIGKIIYFANRYHLEVYGRFIIDDRIVAMKNGPVLSNLYNMMKSVRGENNAYREAKSSLSYDKGKYRLVIKRQPDMDYLSYSDVECLEKATYKIKNMSFRELEKFSHDSLYHTADIDDDISTENIINHSSNPDELRDYLAG